MWILVALYVLLLPGVALFVHEKHRFGETPKAVALKAGCTTVIVLAAVAGVANVSPPLRTFAVLAAAGLVFGLVGDVVICQKPPEGMLYGMLFFALGHLSYIGAFFSISKHRIWALPAFCVLYGALLLIVRKTGLKLDKLTAAALVYGAIIACMVSLSFTLPASIGRGWVLLVGAVLFAVSDALLGCREFLKIKNDSLDTFGLYCYFIGQSLFAVSIYCLR